MPTLISTQYKLPQSVVGTGITTGNSFSNTSNVLLVDDKTTNSNVGVLNTSDIIIGNFNLNVPFGAVITGIKLKLVAKRGAQTSPVITITPVLVNDTNATNTNEYYSGTAYTGLTTDIEDHFLGGNNDLFGKTSWSSDEINNLKVQLLASGDIEVDSCLAEAIYYIPSNSPSPSPSTTGCADCNSTIEALPFVLAKTMRAGDTKFILKSFGLIDNEPITLAMLGGCGGEIGITFDKGQPMIPGSNFQEDAVITSVDAVITTLPNGFIEIDLGDVTNRGIRPNTPYGHDADLMSDHNEGTKVIISNSARYQDRFLQKCHIDTLVSAPIYIEDEGVVLTDPVHTIDFVGPGVSVVNDGTDSFKKIVTITSSTGVQSVTDDGQGLVVVDNTDPDNPVVGFDQVALAGDTTFLNALTSNATFQTAVNNFVTGGGSGGGSIQIDQTPSNGTYGLLTGAVNGTNKVFTVSLNEYTTGKLEVFLNGLIQLQGTTDDWKETTPASGTFEFIVAPAINDIITVVYTIVAVPVATLDVQLNGVSVEDPVDTINFIAPTGIVSTPSTGVVDVDLSALIAGGARTIAELGKEYKLSYMGSTPNYLKGMAFFGNFLVWNNNIFSTDSNTGALVDVTSNYSVAWQDGWCISEDGLSLYTASAVPNGALSNATVQLNQYDSNFSLVQTSTGTVTGSENNTVRVTNSGAVPNCFNMPIFVKGTKVVFLNLALAANNTGSDYYAVELTISGTSLTSAVATNLLNRTYTLPVFSSRGFSTVSTGTVYIQEPTNVGVKSYTYASATFTLIATHVYKIGSQSPLLGVGGFNVKSPTVIGTWRNTSIISGSTNYISAIYDEYTF